MEDLEQTMSIQGGGTTLFGKKNKRVVRLEELRAKREEQKKKDLYDRVNTILRRVRKSKESDAWRKSFKGEHRSAITYRIMLKRLGMDTKHAKYAPWFKKSVNVRLMRCSEALAARMEESYNMDLEHDTTKLSRDQMVALLAKQAEEDRRNKRDDREQVAREIRAAYFGVSFPRPRTPTKLPPEHPKERARTGIMLDRKTYAPPGQAEPIERLESRNFQSFYNYWGRWKNGMMESQFGRYEFSDGGTYVGAFKANKMSGHGTATYPNGSEYVGEWKASRFNGTGRMTYASGCVYEGAWLNGRRHGKGKMTYPSGHSYSGEWLRGEKHGRGTAIAKSYNGGEYEFTGDWVGGMVRGRGILTLPTGESMARANWPSMTLAGIIAHIDQQETDAKELRAAERHRLYATLDFIKVNEWAEADRKRRRDYKEKLELDAKLERRAAHQERIDAKKAAKQEMMEKLMREIDAKEGAT